MIQQVLMIKQVKLYLIISDGPQPLSTNKLCTEWLNDHLCPSGIGMHNNVYTTDAEAPHLYVAPESRY